ncbi:DNA methylase N-4 [Sphingobium chungbukense]|uniref:site-specific DNA-methyltransferase (adenine-specific) n=2 Tax=Sphingobium chungbukense TaxID=56193 RepID=A0A0M3AZ17_9SPHN|nr:DNA methylase N-4 [Sphingobium chungbukense]
MASSASDALHPDYLAFLEAKIPLALPAGFPCDLDEVPTHLSDGRPMKEHVRHIVRWAVEGGRRALFESFGLHKTMQQLLIGSIICRKANCWGIIILPLNVRREFIRDAALLDIPVAFAQADAEIDAILSEAALRCQPRGRPLILTNYESVREGKIDISRFGWASLDEADVLRSFGSKTYQEFLPLFEQVPYRHVATATPAPNRYKEMIHYAGFLGIMDTGQALTRFFQRNSEKAGDLTLYPHKVDEFWIWVNSWAVCIQRPSDLGFSDEGYDLPPITVRWHSVQADIASNEIESNGQGRLIRDSAMGVVGASREKRRTIDARIEKVAEIIAAAPSDHFIVWHDLEDERRAIEAALPACETVYGAQKLDEREEIVTRFADGKLQMIGAKPVMLGGGVNLQRHCHREIFAGVGFKFRDFIQAIHRVQRFGQEFPVEIDIIHAETETEVVRELQEKWARDDEFRVTMSDLIRRYGLNHGAAAEAVKRSIGCARQEASGTGWTLAHNDCVAEAERLADNSLDLIVTSIPFSNHYEYTPSYNDFGHTDDDAHFFAQMDFLTPQLLRALAPGRLACIHVKDRILFGSVTGEGVPTVNPFHAKCIEHYMRHGFQFMGMITVVTDVVRENNQTYRLSYSEMLKDGTKMGVGSPEYVLLMRKPQSDRSRGYADTPVAKSADDYSLARWQVDAHAFWRSSGERPLTIPELWEVEERFAHMATGKIVKRFREETRDLIYSFRSHVEIGEQIEERGANDQRGHLPRTFMALAPGSHHPDVWDDVVRMRTLNAQQVQKGREKHVCPLQFDIVDRLIERYSAKGDLVYDPFCGLGTVPMRAILSGRRGAGSELNPDYWAHSVAYLREAEDQMAVPSLFDLIDLEEDQPTERAA